MKKITANFKLFIFVQYHYNLSQGKETNAPVIVAPP